MDYNTNNMTIQDFKVYMLNASAIFISNTNIDYILKTILILVSIGYTAQRWWILIKNDKEL